MRLHWAARLFMALAAVGVAAPIIVVMAAALNGGRTMTFPPENPTLSRFAEFFVNEPVWRDALWNSIVIALSSAALAVLLAWPIAYWVWSVNDRASRALAAMAALPFALPPIVFGVGLGFLWGAVGGLGTYWAVILSHTALFLALPLVTISIGLQSVDRAHLDAAATMGATPGVTWRTIILPQVLPYTASGFFFAMVLSFNEFIVTFFVTSSSFATVTLQIFNSLRNGFTPTMAVAAVTFIFVSAVGFSIVARYSDLPRLLGADQSR